MYCISFTPKDNEAVVDEVNHTDRTIYRHNIALVNRQVDSLSYGVGSGGGGAGAMAAAAAQLFVREPTDAEIANKLTQPVFVTYLDTDKIEFEKWVMVKHLFQVRELEILYMQNCIPFSLMGFWLLTFKRF